jgi:hypothetical protein
MNTTGQRMETFASTMKPFYLDHLVDRDDLLHFKQVPSRLSGKYLKSNISDILQSQLLENTSNLKLLRAKKQTNSVKRMIGVLVLERGKLEKFWLPVISGQNQILKIVNLQLLLIVLKVMLLILVVQFGPSFAV